MTLKKFLLLLPFLVIVTIVNAQLFRGALQFNTGQEHEITMNVKTTVAQQVNEQAIDFTIDVTGIHTYKVTNATADNSTLRHKVNQMTFSFEGMGQQRNFDSKNEKDMNGPFGPTMKTLLERSYDMVIDTTGLVLMAIPERFEPLKTDSRMALINNLLKEVLDIVEPPAKGSASFFHVLPGEYTGIGDTWTRSWQTSGGEYMMAFILSSATDSTLLVDFTASSVTKSSMEMMGQETTTTMNNKSSGKIVLDRNTLLIREQTIMVDGAGSTETAFGTLPVNVKSTITVNVAAPKDQSSLSQ